MPDAPPADRPLRIAMTSYYLPSESKIGAGHQAHLLADALARRGHDVTMFSPCGAVEGAAYQHVHLPMSGHNRTFRWSFVVRDLDLSGFDVAHFAGDDQWLAGRRRPAHVRTLMGSCLAEAVHIPGAREKARMALLGAQEVLATAVADRSVCISDNTRRWFPWVRSVVSCGVDLDRFRPGGERSEVPTIVFVGTYERRKRGRLLMEAFEQHVRPALPDARLWMVCTDAPDAPGVEVLGRLGDDELAERYRQAWVFCLPSSYEGFGVPYVEAMASGTPVVATPNVGAREILDDGRYGVLAEPDELGPALLALLTDGPRRARLAEVGLARARRYRWEAVAVSYETIYRDLLAHPRRR